MYIKEINIDTSFVRVVDIDSNEAVYFVEEKIDKGLRTIVTTNDPLKARLYTVAEAYKVIYDSLSEHQRKHVVEAHTKDESYGILSTNLNQKFKVLTTESINYGYSGDVEAEQKLLTQLDLEYMYKGEQVILKDVNDL